MRSPSGAGGFPARLLRELLYDLIDIQVLWKPLKAIQTSSGAPNSQGIGNGVVVFEFQQRSQLFLL
jgi:hypothetical protein